METELECVPDVKAQKLIIRRGGSAVTVTVTEAVWLKDKQLPFAIDQYEKILATSRRDRIGELELELIKLKQLEKEENRKNKPQL